MKTKDLWSHDLDARWTPTRASEGSGLHLDSGDSESKAPGDLQQRRAFIDPRLTLNFPRVSAEL